MGDEALIAIAKGCSLQRLSISGCRQIGDTGVNAIARGCPELSYLDVSVLQVRACLFIFPSQKPVYFLVMFFHYLQFNFHLFFPVSTISFHFSI